MRAYITHPAARECHTQSRQGLGFTEAECKKKGSLRFGNCDIDILLVIPNVKQIWMRLQKWKQTSSCSHCCFNCAAVMSLPGASERERYWTHIKGDGRSYPQTGTRACHAHQHNRQLRSSPRISFEPGGKDGLATTKANKLRGNLREISAAKGVEPRFVPIWEL